MKFKNRIVRLTVALAVTATISAQIPLSGGVAQAQDACDFDSGSGGSGGTVRGLIQGAVFLLVGYGIYGTITDRRGGGSTSTIPPATTAEESKPIWDVLSGNADFSILADVTDKSGLKEALRSEGPFTVFAPTNTAIGTVPTETMTDLQKPENADKLKTLLSYHVVKGKYTIEQLKALTANKPEGVQLESIVPGQTVTITNDGGLRVNGTPIVETDIPASNGVIHSIGSVLAAPGA